jgi:retron-type reverse transcriptase
LCTYRGELPQGAPTSSILLDFVLFPLDEELTSAAKTDGLNYSRYADDLTISGGRKLTFFERKVANAVARLGLHLNHEKSRMWGPPRRATITGLVLARRPVLRLDYVKAVIAIAEEFNGGGALLSESELNSIRGRVAWIRQIHPRIGARLERLVEVERD